jgi:hypothetical protein
MTKKLNRLVGIFGVVAWLAAIGWIFIWPEMIGIAGAIFVGLLGGFGAWGTGRAAPGVVYWVSRRWRRHRGSHRAPR